MTSLPTALFKSTPDDFVVDEIDAYPPSGAGPHVLVRVRKRGLTTDAAITRIAAALGVERNAAGAAGMKDKEAVTTQRLSFLGTTPEAAMALAGRWDDLEVLEAASNQGKLKPGHLAGNRFVIRLRELPAEAIDAVVATLERVGREGFPNSFGPQRFGRDGANAERALAFVRGDARPPRDPRERRLYFSALQSRWFNRVLDARIQDGTFTTPLLGDLLKKHATGGMFLCEDPTVDGPRAAALELSPTGPIFGAEMTRPGPEVFARELEVLSRDGIELAHLEAHRKLGEGTRRILRVLVEGMRVERDGETLVVTMTLPKGAYATTALATAVALRGPPRQDARPQDGGTLATAIPQGHRRPDAEEEDQGDAD